MRLQSSFSTHSSGRNHLDSLLVGAYACILYILIHHVSESFPQPSIISTPLVSFDRNFLSVRKKDWIMQGQKCSQRLDRPSSHSIYSIPYYPAFYTCMYNSSWNSISIEPPPLVVKLFSTFPSRVVPCLSLSFIALTFVILYRSTRVPSVPMASSLHCKRCEAKCELHVSRSRDGQSCWSECEYHQIQGFQLCANDWVFGSWNWTYYGANLQISRPS